MLFTRDFEIAELDLSRRTKLEIAADGYEANKSILELLDFLDIDDYTVDEKNESVLVILPKFEQFMGIKDSVSKWQWKKSLVNSRIYIDVPILGKREHNRTEISGYLFESVTISFKNSLRVLNPGIFISNYDYSELLLKEVVKSREFGGVCDLFQAYICGWVDEYCSIGCSVQILEFLQREKVANSHEAFKFLF